MKNLDALTPKLNLPFFEFKVNDNEIFDSLRKKWVALTPEEWVRQNFIAYLINQKKYPKSLVKIEATIKAFNKSRRCDAIVYSNEIKPLAILEFKRSDLKIDNATFKQVAIYNSAVDAPFLIISNGLDHYCCVINLPQTDFTFLDYVPEYNELLQRSGKSVT